MFLPSSALLLLGQGRHVSCDIVYAFFHALAQDIAREPPHIDVLAQRGDFFLDELANCDLVIPDKRLIQEASLGEILLDSPSTILSTICSGLPSLRACARRISFSLATTSAERRPRDICRTVSCNMQAQVMNQLLEVFRLGHKVGLAVHLDQHGLATAMDVGVNQAFGSNPASFLGSSRQAFSREIFDGRGHIPFFSLGLLAVHHHACTGYLAQLLTIAA